MESLQLKTIENHSPLNLKKQSADESLSHDISHSRLVVVGEMDLGKYPRVGRGGSGLHASALHVHTVRTHVVEIHRRRHNLHVDMNGWHKELSSDLKILLMRSLMQNDNK